MITVTEKALREMVKEALDNKDFAGWTSNSEGPSTVNPNVDPSIAVTDPVNPNFTPQNKTEFGVAVNQLVRNLPDDQMPGLYDTVKTAIDQKSDADEEEDMKKKAAQNGTEQVEEAIRKAVRNIISELKPTVTEAKPDPWKNAPPVTGPLPPVKKIPAGEHGGEYMRRIEKNKADLKKGLGKAVDAYEAPPTAADMGVEEPELADDLGDAEAAAPEAEEPAKRRAYKATALGGMSDVGGKSFEEIANELGFSVAGAKQAVDKALEKAKFLAQDMEEDDREILVLTTMNDYIKYLNKSGELTPADVQLMKDHPDIVRELDGFREFLHNSIRRARKGAELEDPLGEGQEPELDEAEVGDTVSMTSKAQPKAATPPPAPTGTTKTAKMASGKTASIDWGGFKESKVVEAAERFLRRVNGKRKA